MADWAVVEGVPLGILSVAQSSAGEVYFAGYFHGTVDLAPGEVVDLHTSAGDEDAFVTKLAPDGSYRWSRTWGGASVDEAVAVRIGETGRIYVLSTFHGSVDFDFTDGVDTHVASPDEVSAAVTVLDSDGRYVSTTSFGQGDGPVFADSLAVDARGSVYVVGCFANTIDFDPGPEVDEHVSTATITARNAFVTRFNADGSYDWTQSFGGAGNDCATGVAVDADGSPRITGVFKFTVDFDPTAGEDYHSGGIDDVFMMKLGADGSYQWTRTWIGAEYVSDRGRIVCDSRGVAAITGLFRQVVDFDPTNGVDLHSALPGDAGLFLTRIDRNGRYLGTTALTSSEYVISEDIAVDQEGNFFVTGVFDGEADFQTQGNPDIRVATEDTFVTKFDNDGLPMWTRTVGSFRPNESGHRLAAGADGSVTVHGHFASPFDVDPGCEELPLAPAWQPEQFLLRLICPLTSPDANADGIVDLLDFAAMQRCFTGPAPVTCGTGCAGRDLDGDDDIDLDDFTEFQILFGS